MLYSEFLEGTKARDTEYNYRVYKQLEALYMENDNMTKQDVYKAAETLINNEPSEATKNLIAKAENEIKRSSDDIAAYKERIEILKYYIEYSEPAEVKEYKESIREYKKQIKREQAWIARNKFFLNGIA